jgi:hypothetical protein
MPVWIVERMKYLSIYLSKRFKLLSTVNDCDSERRFLTYERNSDKCVKAIAKERMAKNNSNSGR